MSSTVVEEIEFLLQFHLIDCQKLEGHAETLLKRLEQTEQSVSAFFHILLCLQSVNEVLDLKFYSEGDLLFMTISQFTTTDFSQTERLTKRAVGGQHSGDRACHSHRFWRVRCGHLWYEFGQCYVASADEWIVLWSFFRVVCVCNCECSLGGVLYACDGHLTEPCAAVVPLYRHVDDHGLA